jgi:enoyl-CoA hydratase
MVNVERRGPIAIWTIDRPEAKNAIDSTTMRDLSRIVGEAGKDGALRAAVLTGAGDVFVSGGDLRELKDKSTASDAEELTDAGFALTRAIAHLPFPVVCAMPGHAIGGGAELAVACDLRIAERRARIAFVQTRMGVSTAWGTVPRLVALVGPSIAGRLLYTGRGIESVEAKEVGLVDELVEDGHSLETALLWTEEIAKGAPAAVAAMKRLVRETSENIAHAVRPLERELFVGTWSGADHAEAIAAYFERRAPRWR